MCLMISNKILRQLSMTAPNRPLHDALMKIVNDRTGKIFFLDAPSGNGKTFLITWIFAKILSQNEIALALSSSGIAAMLLESGRAAHSHFNFNVQRFQNCAMATLLRQCEMIVWDECTRAHKKSLQSLDRTMQDLRNNQNRFGGAIILWKGDFREILPVIHRQRQPMD